MNKDEQYIDTLQQEAEGFIYHAIPYYVMFEGQHKEAFESTDTMLDTAALCHVYYLCGLDIPDTVSKSDKGVGFQIWEAWMRNPMQLQDRLNYWEKGMGESGSDVHYHNIAVEFRSIFDKSGYDVSCPNCENECDDDCPTRHKEWGYLWDVICDKSYITKDELRSFGNREEMFKAVLLAIGDMCMWFGRDGIYSL